MRNIFLKLVLISIVLIGVSCSQESFTEDIQLEEENYGNKNLKIEFAKALSQSLNQSKELREILKEEALKMFDNDYDVLYHMIKNTELSPGNTVRELILANYEDKDDLTAIENDIPLLTILVPELPEDSFSAKLWDVENEIPEVAIRLNNSNQVPIINNDGEEYELEEGAVPGFPIIVVKENERIVYNAGVKYKNSVAKGKSFASDDGFGFQFLDNVFDRSEQNIAKRVTRRLDQKVKDAYSIYKSVDGWHRDYIYYNLTPTNTKDQFSYDFQEHITSFRLAGDPMNAYKKISDQRGDPKIDDIKFSSKASSWTGGFFEFKVRTLFNAQNGIGEELISYFSAKPDDLFDVIYNEHRTGGLGALYRYFYTMDSVDLRTMNVNLPIFNWDLNQYASSIKIEIEEVDLTVTTVLTDTRTVKFASNFGIDDGILKKIGLKFGANIETTETQTVQKTFTQGNDILGSVIVNFADDVLLKTFSATSWISNIPPIYITREYSSGWYKLSVEPLRVQYHSINID